MNPQNDHLVRATGALLILVSLQVGRPDAGRHVSWPVHGPALASAQRDNRESEWLWSACTWSLSVGELEGRFAIHEARTECARPLG